MIETALQKTLRISELRYRRLFEAARDGILLLNVETAQIEDVNPYLIELLGYSREELLGKKLWEIGAFADTALNIAAFEEIQATGYLRYDDLPLVTRHGRSISVEFVSNRYDVEGTAVIQCNIRDNTKRHTAEIALQAADRALRIVSESNLALLGATTELKLFSAYCRIAVETGGYLMAWVGMAEIGPDQRVVPVAHYGANAGFLEEADMSWADTARGGGPMGRALRTGELQQTDNVAGDPAVAPWRAEALKRDYQSIIALPFRLSDGTMACLAIVAATRDVWSSPERKLLQEISADLAFGIDAIRNIAAKVEFQTKLRYSLEQTIQVISATIGERDAYTAGHQRRVAQLSSAIAVELGLDAERIHGLHLAATIHDLGKIGCPAEILAKPKKLTDIEFSLIKEHARIGFELLKDVDFPWPIAQIILQHHERIDGSGYPDGLKGDALLMESKILAVADVVEAMVSHRPYRTALGLEAALAEIVARSGSKFDPDVVDACVRLFRNKDYRIED